MSPAHPIRHVLITGGSRGIGLSIAQLFAKNSYRCTLIARSPTHLTSALSTLESSHLPSSTPHTSITGDIASASFWEGSSRELGMRGFGGAVKDKSVDEKEVGSKDGHGHGQKDKEKPSQIDVLVNCAGITQSTLLQRTSPEAVRNIIDTNLTAMILGTRCLLRGGFIKRGQDKDFTPAIINVASLLGVKGGRGAVAYAASKAGVLGFTRALAEELGGIRVNAIVPGYIETDMTADLSTSETLLRKIPTGRFGRPEEVAEAALFLAKNQYANNCVINLDGGLSAT